MSLTISTLSQSQIQSLLTAETQQLERPVTNWQNQIKTDQAMISSWGQIGGALSTLSSDLAALQNPASINDRAATSSDTTVATVTAGIGAVVGRYTLTNVAPAQAQSIYSATYASTTTSLGAGAGTLTFTLAAGGSETVSVAAGNATLSGIAQAVNAVSGGSVTASVVGGSGGYRLVLSGAATGAASAFTVSGTGSLAGLTYAASGSSNTFTLATAASDASLDTNGVPVTSATNTLTHAIPGVTVTLSGPGSTTVDVSASASSLSSMVSSIVSDFNAAVQAVQSATAFGGTGAQATANGPLLGNFTATDIGNQLGSAVSGLSVDGLSTRDAGLMLGKDGALTFDSGAFAAAYASNPAAVDGLVSALDTALNNVVQPATGSSVTGTVAEQTSALNQNVTGLDDEISQETDFVNQQILNDANQYSDLLNAQSQYSTWSAYLDAIFPGATSSG